MLPIYPYFTDVDLNLHMVFFINLFVDYIKIESSNYEYANKKYIDYEDGIRKQFFICDVFFCCYF